jgi:mono/diheme cytochrome c family protein
MNVLVRGLLIAALGAAMGCGGSKSADNAKDQASASTGGSGGTATTSKFDQGPRAGESKADEAMAEHGEKLFQEKGCSACHTFGKRGTGPDLAGVTMRRTAQWMENQILHPDVMVKEDPISHQLFGEFALQMPNQGLTPDEAKAVIEYFKHRDHEQDEKADKD